MRTQPCLHLLIVAALTAIVLPAITRIAAAANHNDNVEPIRKLIGEMREASGYRAFKGTIASLDDAVKNYHSTRVNTLKALDLRLKDDDASDDGADGWFEECNKAARDLTRAEALLEGLLSKLNFQEHYSPLKTWFNGERSQWETIVEVGRKMQDFHDATLDSASRLTKDTETVRKAAALFQSYAERLDKVWTTIQAGLREAQERKWFDDRKQELAGLQAICELTVRTIPQAVRDLQTILKDYSDEKVFKTMNELIAAKIDADQTGLYEEHAKTWRSHLKELAGDYRTVYDKFEAVADPFIDETWRDRTKNVNAIEARSWETARKQLYDVLDRKASEQSRSATDALTKLFSDRMKQVTELVKEMDLAARELATAIKEPIIGTSASDFDDDAGTQGTALRSLTSEMGELWKKWETLIDACNKQVGDTGKEFLDETATDRAKTDLQNFIRDKWTTPLKRITDERAEWHKEQLSELAVLDDKVKRIQLLAKLVKEYDRLYLGKVASEMMDWAGVINEGDRLGKAAGDAVTNVSRVQAALKAARDINFHADYQKVIVGIDGRYTIEWSEWEFQKKFMEWVDTTIGLIPKVGTYWTIAKFLTDSEERVTNAINRWSASRWQQVLDDMDDVLDEEIFTGILDRLDSIDCSTPDRLEDAITPANIEDAVDDETDRVAAEFLRQVDAGPSSSKTRGVLDKLKAAYKHLDTLLHKDCTKLDEKYEDLAGEIAARMKTRSDERDRWIRDQRAALETVSRTISGCETNLEKVGKSDRSKHDALARVRDALKHRIDEFDGDLDDLGRVVNTSKSNDWQKVADALGRELQALQRESEEYKRNVDKA